MTLKATRYATTGVLATLWSWLILTVFFAAIPDSPMRLSTKDRAAVMTVLPEGWGFFTRSPREEGVYAYGRAEDGWSELTFGATSARNWFGLLRASRVQGVELGGISGVVPEESWTEHRDPFHPTADLGSIPMLDVSNTAIAQTMCGEVLLERRRPIPWAWSGSGKAIRMPARYVRLVVDCESSPAGAQVAHSRSSDDEQRATTPRTRS